MQCYNRPMIRILKPIPLAAIVALLPAMVSAQQISPAALDALPPADVVFLGEVHDNPAQHANQARAVAAIKPAALVFEMLTPEQAAAGATAPRDDADALAAAVDWAGRGWPDFAHYYPIFAAAPDARLYGAGVPRDAARRAFGLGAAAAFGPDAAQFGLDRPLPAEQQATREAEQMAAHCNALPEEMLGGMVEAQRLRDATLAQAAAQALADTGGPVVVITGNGHARQDRGAPVALTLAVPGASILALGQYETSAPDTPPYDMWLVTQAAEREDPCEAFRKRQGATD